MKKVILLILFVGINIGVFAQFNPYSAMLKYWYYRDRLKYFVVPGTKQGESEILAIRNDFTQGNNYKTSSDGQHGVHFGYYLGMLATEYALLYNSGQDVTSTLNELHLALQQFENYMDENNSYSGQDNYDDGFFVREDIPCDFMSATLAEGKTASGERHIDLLNKNLTPSNVWDNTLERFTGLELGQPGYSDFIHAGGCTQADTTIIMPSREPMSTDEAIGVLMGLALVNKLCPTYASESRMDACNIISWVQNAFSINGPYSWVIYLPNGNSDPSGSGVALEYAEGFEKVADYFESSCIDYWDNPVYDIIWQAQKYFSNPTIYNNSMSAVLAAIGNSWTIGINYTIMPFGNCCSHWWCPCIHVNFSIPATGWGIKNVWNTASREGNETFYLLLWGLINNATTNYLDFSRVDAQISSAPCYGPYNYFLGVHANIDAWGGWASDYRWRDEHDEQQGIVNSGGGGNFNGIDYMLFYNLFSSLIMHYSPPQYVNYNDRYLTGIVTSPLDYAAVNSIVSTQTIEPTPPIVIYEAGDHIELQPGFHAMQGSNFHAFIGQVNGCTNYNARIARDSINNYTDSVATSYNNSFNSALQSLLNSTPVEKVEVIDTLPCGNYIIHINGITDDTTITIPYSFFYGNSSQGDTIISAGTFSYQWNFGNGQTSNNKKVDVHYTTPGLYHCKLIITNNHSANYRSVTDTILFGFLVPSNLCIDTNTIRGILACNSTPISGDTLLLAQNGIPVDSVSPVITQSNGSFNFNIYELAKLDTGALYTIISKSGNILNYDTAKTIYQWIDESPLNLYYLTKCDTNQNSKTTTLNVHANVSDTLKENSFVNIIPNPNNGNMKVSYKISKGETGLLEIYSSFGIKLFNYPLYSGKNSFTISETEIDAGIYFYRATANNKVFAKDKIVVIK